ncbi:Uncharacterised protein [Aeromonas caviae]|nr:Uncharacterised protein [Aeromonas caviae]
MELSRFIRICVPASRIDLFDPLSHELDSLVVITQKTNCRENFWRYLLIVVGPFPGSSNATLNLTKPCGEQCEVFK